MVDRGEIAKKFHQEVYDKNDLNVALAKPIVYLQDVNQYDSCRDPLRTHSNFIYKFIHTVVIESVVNLESIEDPNDTQTDLEDYCQVFGVINIIDDISNHNDPE